MKLKYLLYSTIFVVNTSASLNATCYMQALLDDESMKSIAAIRQAGLTEVDDKRGILAKHFKGKDNYCIDLTEYQNHQHFHVTLNRFNIQDQHEKEILKSALSKVIFEIDGINYSFGKFCVLTLKNRYKIDTSNDTAILPEERDVLSKYIPAEPHISLFKWLDPENAATFKKHEDAYELSDKQEVASNWVARKKQVIQDLTVLSFQSDKKGGAKKKMTKIIFDLLSTIVPPRTELKIGTEGNELTVNSKNLKSQSKIIVERIFAQVVQSRLTWQHLQDVQAEVQEYISGEELFGPLTQSNKVIVTEKKTGSALDTDNLMLLCQGIDAYLKSPKSNPIKIKLHDIFINEDAYVD